ncbi:MAG: sulfotransferase [Gammaproteobacteria bacterium]|jgi:tetratricopeptide (TPR) repeat protein
MQQATNMIAALLREGLARHQQGEQAAARHCYQQVLQQAPDQPDALFLLGRLDAEGGDMASAEKHLRRACRVQPRRADFHQTLGRVYMLLERPAQALKAFETAARLAPDDAELAMQLAGAAHASGNRGKAAETLERACRLAPDLPEAHYNRGLLALELQNLELARDAFRRALELRTDYPAARLGLGTTLGALGDTGTALSELQKLLDAYPQSAEGWHRLGEVMQRAGMIQPSLEAFGKALAIDPGHAGARLGEAGALRVLGDFEKAESRYRELLDDPEQDADARTGLAELLHLAGRRQEARDLSTGLLKRGNAPRSALLLHARILADAGETAEARRLLDSLSGKPETASDPLLGSAIAFQLGNLAEREGNRAAAWGHFVDANRLKPVPREATPYLEFMDTGRGFFTPGRIAELPRRASGDEQPIFIVGMPRSGTSLAEQILAAHRTVAPAGEYLGIDDATHRLQQTHAPTNYPACLAEATDATLAEIATGYLAGLPAEARAADAFTDKTPTNFMHLGLIRQLFPRARIIHCRRSPLDTLLSCYFQDFASRDMGFTFEPEELVRVYEAYRQLMDHWRGLDIPMFELDYETLVSEPESTVRALLDFLGLDFDEACLDHSRHNQRVVATASFAQARRPIYTSSVGRFRDYREFLSEVPAFAALLDDE